TAKHCIIGSARLIPVICHMVELAVSNGYFPDKLKTSTIIPIYKKGDRNKYENYRPIVIQSTLAKVIDKFLSNRVHEYINKIEFLSAAQYGFRKTKNTRQALHKIIDCAINSYDKNKHVAVIAVDFEKAFDSVNHDILLDKLYQTGIRGNLHNLLM